MTKVEQAVEGPFWVKFGQEWWPCRLLEKEDIPKNDKALKRLWQKKLPDSKSKVFCYGVQQGAVVSNSFIKPFEENYLSFSEQELGENFQLALASVRASLLKKRPRLEKPTCVKCNVEWTEEDLGPNSTALVCEFCEEEYHLACARLKKVPLGKWFCFDCRKAVPLVWKQILEKAPLDELPDENLKMTASSIAEAGIGKKRPREDHRKDSLQEFSDKKNKTLDTNGLRTPHKNEDKAGDKTEQGSKKNILKVEGASVEKSKSKVLLGKSTSTSTRYITIKDIRDCLEKCYIPRIITKNKPVESWLDLKRYRWFFLLIQVADRSFKDTNKIAETIERVLNTTRWDEKQGQKWEEMASSIKKRLRELLRMVRQKPDSLRYVKFKTNQLIEEVLGFLAAEANIVTTFSEEIRTATDLLIKNFREQKVQFTIDKSEFKDKVLTLLNRVGLTKFDGTEKSKLHYVILHQLSQEGAQWPERKPKILSRENVFMAFSFYEGIALWYRKPALDQGAKTVSVKLEPAALKQEKIEHSEAGGLLLKTDNPDGRCARSKEYDSTTNMALSEKGKQITKVSLEKASTRLVPKIEHEKKQSVNGIIPLDNKVKAEPVRYDSLNESLPEPESKVTAADKEGNLNLSAKSNTTSSDYTDRSIKVEQHAEKTEMPPSLHEKRVSLVLRPPLDFSHEANSWYSPVLANEAGKVIKNVDNKAIDKNKSAGFLQLLPHGNSFEIDGVDATHAKEEDIPILPEEHMSIGFMQPGLSWWGVKECELTPCEDSDNDTAPTKKRSKGTRELFKL